MGFDDKKSDRGDPEHKHSTPRGSGVRKQTSFLARAFASDSGRSGYGSESVRPYLRAQLRLRELMGAPFQGPQAWDQMVRKKARKER